MSIRSRMFVGISLLLTLVLGACAPAATPIAATTAPTQAAAVEAAQPTEAVAAAPTQAASEPAKSGSEPTTLKIAIMNPTAKEQPWNTALLQSMERVVAQKPHGLTISYIFQEQISNTDGARVMGELAASGEYGIIWGHDAYPDAIDSVAPQYPNIAFVGAGSGYDPSTMGENRYWVDMDVHEAAYLAGVIAGKMTKSNVVGAVGAYPYANVNAPINAFFDGARSVNPNVKVRMNYINSWYDPAKAKEATLAEIAAGADYIYAERFGVFEAAKEKGVYAFGHFTDQNELAPGVVLSSSLAYWDPVINTIIDAWWNHTVHGTPYAAPTDKAIVYSMKDGGCDIAPFHGLDSMIPQEVKDLVDKTRSDIKSGKLEVKLNAEEVKGD